MFLNEIGLQSVCTEGGGGGGRKREIDFKKDQEERGELERVSSLHGSVITVMLAFKIYLVGSLWSK